MTENEKNVDAGEGVQRRVVFNKKPHGLHSDSIWSHMTDEDWEEYSRCFLDTDEVKLQKEVGDQVEKIEKAFATLLLVENDKDAIENAIKDVSSACGQIMKLTKENLTYEDGTFFVEHIMSINVISSMIASGTKDQRMMIVIALNSPLNSIRRDLGSFCKAMSAYKDKLKSETCLTDDVEE